VVTKDRSPSAHFEHTVLVTETQPEILTCLAKMSSLQKAQ
jgi:methionine aminopeptidase